MFCIDARQSRRFNTHKGQVLLNCAYTFQHDRTLGRAKMQMKAYSVPVLPRRTQNVSLRTATTAKW